MGVRAPSAAAAMYPPGDSDSLHPKTLLRTHPHMPTPHPPMTPAAKPHTLPIPFPCTSHQDGSELDAALARFLAWVHAVHVELVPRGRWVDAVDPATGRALLGRPGSKPWAEAEAARHLLGYGVAQGVSSCALLVHPRLGERCFVLSFRSMGEGRQGLVLVQRRSGPWLRSAPPSGCAGG